MSPIPGEVLQKLDEVEDWPGLIRKMIGYGVWLAKVEYKWRAGTILPKGHDIKDLVYKVVRKLYAGERTWKPSKVSLEDWLRLNIRSEMNNLFRSAYTRSGELREVPLETDEGSNVLEIERPGAGRKAPGLSALDPEAILLKRERRDKLVQMIEALYEALEGDEVLEDIYFEIIDGCPRKPRILAKRLGISKREVNNALRRLDRRVKRVKAKQGENDG